MPETRARRKASGLSKTVLELSIGVGAAFGSVVAAGYLGGVPTSEHSKLIAALHHAFVPLGGQTMLTAISFTRLQAIDGATSATTATQKRRPRKCSVAARAGVAQVGPL